MAVTYYQLGGQRRLHEIIFAGSHDAAITSGKSHAQTQDLDIAGQADAGVRLFDLRILAHGGEQGASLVGYHGSPQKPKSVGLISTHTKKSHDVKVSKKMSTGTVGLKLSAMLEQAKMFVSRGGPKEFLILKFDKCTNWQLIAEYCVNILGDSIYKDKGIEFSKLTLDDLSRKVVCVFNDSVLTGGKITGYGPKDGIFGFRSLKAKKGPNLAYKPGYQGLQYFGKGGTDALKIYQRQSDKMNENVSKQRRLMLEMANADDLQSPNVLGMMYWTSTGTLSSIKKRNKVMWSAKTGIPKMETLWGGGLEASIGHQLELDRIKCLEYGGKQRIKAFFPNIIMIDFASEDKCRTIYKLNEIKDKLLADAYNEYMGEV